MKIARNKSHRQRISKYAMDTHWDDLEQRYETAILTCQLVTRAFGGKEHRYARKGESA